jgi:GTPase involved in cell partitioning and DNA repair
MSQLSEDKQVSAQELTEVIEELEQYRDRLYNDTMAVAKKAKKLQPMAKAQLEPELTKIDARLDNLRHQLATLSAK